MLSARHLSQPSDVGYHFIDNDCVIALILKDRIVNGALSSAIALQSFTYGHFLDMHRTYPLQPLIVWHCQALSGFF